MKKIISKLLCLALLMTMLAVPMQALNLNEAKDLIDELYYQDVPKEVFEEKTINDMVEALGDPYTYYMTEEEYNALKKQVNGDVIVGIGIVVMDIDLDNPLQKGIIIDQVIENSPAEKAGLEKGDIILRVDGVEIDSVYQATPLLQGEEGSRVTIGYRQHSSNKMKEVTLQRAVIEIPIFYSEMKDDVLWITIDSFGEIMDEEIVAALDKASQSTAPYILDLRDNPGGYLETALQGLSIFTDGERRAGYLQFKGGDSTQLFTYDMGNKANSVPLIVLQNENSASASEFFSAAVRDWGVGISIGTRSYGKGIGQYWLDEYSMPNLFDGDAMSITVMRFFSPDGLNNHHTGVMPTLTIANQHITAVAQLLSFPRRSASSVDDAKIKLAGLNFYVSKVKAQSNKAAMAELLSALPYDAEITISDKVITVEKLAARWEIPYTSRGFSDIEQSFAKDSILRLSQHALISGDGQGHFLPERNVTRAEFSAMVAKALNLQVKSGTSFQDVPSTAWYAGAVNAMYQEGLIAGVGDGTFRPNASVTCQEAVTILAQVSIKLSFDGAHVQSYTPSDEILNVYSDFDPWARKWAYALDFFDGLDLPTQTPKEQASRATVAHLIYTSLDSLHFFW